MESPYEFSYFDDTRIVQVRKFLLRHLTERTASLAISFKAPRQNVHFPLYVCATEA